MSVECRDISSRDTRYSWVFMDVMNTYPGDLMAALSLGRMSLSVHSIFWYRIHPTAIFITSISALKVYAYDNISFSCSKKIE